MFTAEKQTRLRQLRAEKAPIWQQLAEMQCSHGALNNEVKRLGLPLLRRPIDKRKFAERWAAGVLVEDLALEFGRKPQGIWVLARKLDLPARPRTKWWEQVAQLKAENATLRAEIARLKGVAGPNGATKPRREDREGVPRRA